MPVNGPHRRRPRGIVPGIAGLALLIGAPSAGVAAPPAQPLPSPKYSFDRASPHVQSGAVTARGILSLTVEGPQTHLPGMVFGLSSDGDELDALSGANAGLASPSSLALLFSIDTQSAAVNAPAPELVELGVPHNAFEQVIRGHAAGDEFMTTLLIDWPDLQIVAPTPLDWNNVLVRNNFDEGGTDFGASPETSAVDIVTNAAQDCVDAMAVFDGAAAAVYFSASRDSPSLPGLQGQGVTSGADIYVFQPTAVRSAGASCPTPATTDQQGAGGLLLCEQTCCDVALTAYEDCMADSGDADACAALYEAAWQLCLREEACLSAAASATQLYASHVDLGLQPEDDIDALIVFDTNADAVFNALDRVVFSLTPDSPSLLTIPGASDVGAAADVFAVSAALAGITVLATAGQLGLGSPDDNIDALDIVPCSDALACATAYGIRAAAPIPTMSALGAAMLFLLLLIAGVIVVQRRHVRDAASA